MNAEVEIRPEMDSADDGVLCTFVALMEELQELEGIDRREALTGWVRTDWFSGCGLLLEGWQGALHREAWRYHRADLEAETAGKAWRDAGHEAGRSTIERLLGVEGSGWARYAAYPFRIVWTQEDEPWIGGAVGCEPLLDARAMMRWAHIDIRHVILWNPKTGKTRLYGDAQRATLILPEPLPDTLDVYTDTLAFFRAWARRRAHFASVRRAHGLTEDRDGHLPGALAIGGIDRVRFPHHVAATLVAQPPLSRSALSNAVLRSANLPVVKEAGGARV